MKKKRLILVSLATTLLLSLSIIKNEKKESVKYSSSMEFNTQPIQFINSNNYQNNFQHEKETSNINRDEVFKKSLKGYREQTYWGNEHSISEETKQLNDKEFDSFVEDEIKAKNVDVYWGADY